MTGSMMERLEENKFLITQSPNHLITLKNVCWGYHQNNIRRVGKAIACPPFISRQPTYNIVVGLKPDLCLKHAIRDDMFILIFYANIILGYCV